MEKQTRVVIYDCYVSLIPLENITKVHLWLVVIHCFFEVCDNCRGLRMPRVGPSPMQPMGEDMSSEIVGLLSNNHRFLDDDGRCWSWNLPFHYYRKPNTSITTRLALLF